jgi:plastocyanin
MVGTKSLFTLLQSSLALAATVNVNVGGNKQLIFSPNTINANAGDTVKFTFLDQNHTVTAGNPNAGCQPSGQFNSGFVPVANNTNAKPSFSVAVANTNPITVYCAQAQHCQVGMVMVINPTSTVSYAVYSTHIITSNHYFTGSY